MENGKGIAKIRNNKKGKKKIIKNGIPISPGIAEGRIMKISTFPSRPVEKTDVVVVNHLKPFIAPFLLKAAAIVIEEGGEFSHAGIIARELGIPCMVIPKITTLVNDNDMVVIDAIKGNIKYSN